MPRPVNRDVNTAIAALTLPRKAPYRLLHEPLGDVKTVGLSSTGVPAGPGSSDAGIAVISSLGPAVGDEHRAAAPALPGSPDALIDDTRDTTIQFAAAGSWPAVDRDAPVLLSLADQTDIIIDATSGAATGAAGGIAGSLVIPVSTNPQAAAPQVYPTRCGTCPCCGIPLNGTAGITTDTAGVVDYSASASGSTTDRDDGATFSQPLSSIAWGTALDDNNVTFYFAPAGGTYQSGTQTITSSAWNAYEIQQFGLGLQLLSNVTALTFTQVFTQAGADFTLVNTATLLDNNGNNNVLGRFGAPDTGASAGFGYFNNSGSGWDENDSNGGLQLGGYGFITIIHEVGHGLGLAHPHDNGGTSTILPGVTGPFGSYGDSGLNQGIFTMMSYNDGYQSQLGTSGSNLYGYEGTPMALDIAVLQTLYGANATFAPGSDTYTLPDANAAGTFFSAVWDTAGIDQFVYNGNNDATIDLRAATLQHAAGGGGYLSSAAGIFGGFTIANGVVIENASGGSGNDSIVGNTANNTINGGGGIDTISGGDGNDTLNGGDAADTIYGGIGTDTLNGDAGNDTLTGDNGADTLNGGADFDFLYGNAGNDTLDGGTGADLMVGGTEHDTYFVDDAGDVVTENAGEGTDTVKTTLSSYLLGAGLEKLIFIGTGDFVGTGNGLNNTIAGGSGNDTLNGLGGSAGSDTLNGGWGNDTLNGGIGADTMNGGGDHDTYIVDNAGDIVYEAASQGIDTVQTNLAGYALTANVEKLIYTGSGSFAGTGNDRPNTITGGGLADTLDGGTGIDTLTGLAGDDTYYVDDPGDLVVETVGGGYDTVYSSASTYTLAAEVEGLGLIGSSFINGFGNGLNNVLSGNSAHNVLRGGGGDDVLVGSTGAGDADILWGDVGADEFYFGSLTAYSVIGDFDQSGGSFNIAEGDQIDLSALLSGPYNQGAGIPVSQLAQIVVGPSGYADLQINLDGIGDDWQTIAQLDGVTLGQEINLILDPTMGAGVSITPHGRELTFVGAYAGSTFDPGWNGYTTIIVLDGNGNEISRSYYAHWEDANGFATFPVATDELTIANNIDCVLIGVDFYGQTDAADSLTIAADSSLTMQSGDLVLGAGLGNDGRALENTGALTIINGFLTIGGDVYNSGVITLQTNGNNYYDGNAAIRLAADVTLSGGGSIVLQPNGVNLNQITGNHVSNATTLHNVDNTISGAGTIGKDGLYGDPHYVLALDNQGAGRIEATSAAGPLVLRTTSIHNDGVLIANGGTLAIVNNNVTQSAAGVIAASGVGSVVTLEGVTVAGGLLDADDGTIATVGYAVVLDSNSAGAITNLSTFTVSSNSSVTLQGTIHNQGTFLLTTNGNNYYDGNAYIIVALSGATLDGGGSVVLQANGNNLNEITGSTTSAAATLHNVDNTISGAGTIGKDSLYGDAHYLLHLDNQAAGVVNANTASALWLRSLTVSNAGTLESTSAGGLWITSTTITQTGAGAIKAIGAGSHVDLNDVTINGGLLTTSNGGVIKTTGPTKLDGSPAYGQINIAGAFVVTSYTTLTLAGTIHNTGSISLQTNGNNYYDGNAIISIAAGDVTLNGGGTIVFQSAGVDFNEITGSSTIVSTTLHNVDNTISGAGTIGRNATYGDSQYLLAFDNQAAGTVNANVAGHALALNSLTVSNAGTIKATASGTISLINATVNQTGAGVLRADGAGSHVDLNGATIVGGLLATSGGGLFRVIGGTNTLDSSTAYGAVTNAGSLVVNSGNALLLVGTIHNTGTMTLQTNGNNYYDGNTILNIAAGGVTLTGGGTIKLQSAGVNLNEITGYSPTLSTTLHNVDNTIFGAGTIGRAGLYGDSNLLLEFNNQAGGTVNANVAGHAIVLNSLTVNNAGVIKATAGGTIALVNATVNQTGTGVIRADGSGSHVDLNNATIVGGLLTRSSGGFFQVTGGTNTLDGSTDYGAVTSAAAIKIGSSLSLQLKGTIHNNATIALYTNGNDYYDGNTYLITLGDVTLDGGGSIVLVSSGADNNEITGYSTTLGSTLHNVNNMISGAGTIGRAGQYGDPQLLLDFDNQAAGIVDANVAGHAIALNSLTVSNAGTLKATSGGIIALVNATLNQTGAGVIRADGAGSRIDLFNSTIAGGLLAGSGGGYARVTGGTNILDGTTAFGAVNNATSIDIGSSLSLQLKGAINNTGSIRIQTNGNNYYDGNTALYILADTTLTGGGGIVLQSAGVNLNEITGVSTVTAMTLHNFDNTIAGAGTIGKGGLYGDPNYLLIFDNQAGGTVNANVAGYSLVLNTGATVTNNGILRADGGTLVINDAVIGSGHAVITGGGTMVFNGNYQQNIVFSGEGHAVLPGASMTLGGYTGYISGWDSNDTVDVAGLGYQNSYRVQVTLSGPSEILYIVDSANNNAIVAQLGLTGAYVSDNFVLSSDGSGGTLISERPSTPANLALAVAADQGAAGDQMQLGGTGDVGATVTLYDGVTVVGSAIVAAGGTWSITTTSLAGGSHSLSAVETDSLGMTSPASATIQLEVNLGTPNALIFSGTSDTDRFTGGAGNDTLNGAAGNDTLGGGNGNDTIDGGADADTMSGNGGNDTFLVDNAGDVVTEASGQGVDTIETTLNSYTLPDNVENLVFIGSGDFIGTGNNRSNTITGALGTDTLTGGDGNDTLDGGAGADTLIGNAGNDTYVVDHAGDVVSESGGGIDLVNTTLLNYTLTPNVDKLVFTGSGDFVGTGNGLNNTISSGAGNDTLTGLGGNDTLNGGWGDDTLTGGANADTMNGGGDNDIYVVDNVGDVVNEAASQGIDTVQTTLASYTLPANVEKLIYIGSGNFSGTGNDRHNTITGGAGADTLDGMTGNDTLAGGLGNDLLTGGLGLDSFLFDTALNAATNLDQIFDFSSVDDKVLLSSSIFAAAGPVGTLAAGAFVTGAAAGDAGDRIIYNSATGALSYDTDGAGAAAATQFATLSAGLALTSGNFRIM
jgi:Ca2+-binding RTX toxin-like protein